MYVFPYTVSRAVERCLINVFELKINKMFRETNLETEIDNDYHRLVTVGVNCKWKEENFWEWWKFLTLDCEDSYTVIY